MNRRLRLKNSYMTIFPMYGLQDSKNMFRTTQFITIGKDVEKEEPINKLYFSKHAREKTYFEEMLKAKNMRMDKHW